MPVSRVIEPHFNDPLHDCGREPFMRCRAGRKRDADLRGGGWVITADDVEPVALAGQRCFPAGEDGEFDAFREPFRMLPAEKRVPLVAAHDPEETARGKPLRHGFGRSIGAGRSCLNEFEIIDLGPRQIGGGEAEHFEAFLADGRRGAGFVRGNPAGKEADFIQAQRLARQLGEMEVAEVDGIKGSSKEAYLAGDCHEVLVY